jgi:hypothetical protein
MSVNSKLCLIPNGTEFYAIESLRKLMTGIFLHTAPRVAYFVCPEQGIMQGSVGNIMDYYYRNFLKISPPEDTDRDPFAHLYVAKGAFLGNSLKGILATLTDEQLAMVGTVAPASAIMDRLNLLPRNCPCYIKIGTWRAWTGIAIHNASRQGLSSGFFSDDSYLCGATAEEAIKQYMNRYSLTNDVVFPLQHIYLAAGPHKSTSLAHMLEHGSDLALRDCLQPPLELCPTIRDDLRRTERVHMKAIVEGRSCRRVNATVEGLGTLEGTLDPDGSFSYEDGEVGHMSLNSFELLWFLRKKYSNTTGVNVPLQSRIEMDPEYALRFIFFRDTPSKSLIAHADDVFKDLPALIPVPPSYEVLLERLEDKEKALLAEIKILEEIEERKARIQVLTNKRNVLKSHLDE